MMNIKNILNHIYDGGLNFILYHMVMFFIILGVLCFQNYHDSVILGNEGLLVPICTFYALLYTIFSSILTYSMLHILAKVTDEN